MNDLINRQDACENACEITRKSNANDTISRQDAIDAIERDAYRHTYLDQIIDVIKDLPSAQRKGKWMSHPNADCPEWDVCTCCGVGCKRREYGEENGKTWVTEYSYQYCPNCGARMGEQDEKE